MTWLTAWKAGPGWPGCIWQDRPTVGNPSEVNSAVLRPQTAGQSAGRKRPRSTLQAWGRSSSSSEKPQLGGWGAALEVSARHHDDGRSALNRSWVRMHVCAERGGELWVAAGGRELPVYRERSMEVILGSWESPWPPTLSVNVRMHVKSRARQARQRP